MRDSSNKAVVVMALTNSNVLKGAHFSYDKKLGFRALRVLWFVCFHSLCLLHTVCACVSLQSGCHTQQL